MQFLASNITILIFCLKMRHKTYTSSSSRCAARSSEGFCHKRDTGLLLHLRKQPFASISPPKKGVLAQTEDAFPHPQSVTRELTIRPRPARDGGSAEPEFGANPPFSLGTRRFIVSLDTLGRKGARKRGQTLAVSEFVSKANSQTFCPTARA